MRGRRKKGGEWLPAPVSEHEDGLLAGMAVGVCAPGARFFVAEPPQNDIWVRREKGEDERGNGFSWCAPGARFFVAEPPQNDIWVEGKGEDRFRPPCRSTRTGFSPE